MEAKFQTTASALPPRTTGSAGLLSQFGVRMNYARGEEIFAQEEEADLLYQVVSGSVRTSRVLSDGRRQIGDFYFAGDVFGVERREEHAFAAEAMTDLVRRRVRARRRIRRTEILVAIRESLGRRRDGRGNPARNRPPRRPVRASRCAYPSRM